MPETLPVEIAKELSEKHNLRQVIVLAWDGSLTHVVTYGESVDDSDQAADGGNRIKKALGWPEELQAESPKVAALRAELEAQKARIATLERERDLFKHLADNSHLSA